MATPGDRSACQGSPGVRTSDERPTSSVPGYAARRPDAGASVASDGSLGPVEAPPGALECRARVPDLSLGRRQQDARGLAPLGQPAIEEADTADLQPDDLPLGRVRRQLIMCALEL